MKRIAVIILSLFLLTWCSKITDRVIVTHIGGGFKNNPFVDTVADGCSVSTQGDMKGIKMSYVDKQCVVTINGGVGIIVPTDEEGNWTEASLDVLGTIITDYMTAKSERE